MRVSFIFLHFLVDHWKTVSVRSERRVAGWKAATNPINSRGRSDGPRCVISQPAGMTDVIKPPTLASPLSIRSLIFNAGISIRNTRDIGLGSKPRNGDISCFLNAKLREIRIKRRILNFFCLLSNFRLIGRFYYYWFRYINTFLYTSKFASLKYVIKKINLSKNIRQKIKHSDFQRIKF